MKFCQDLFIKKLKNWRIKICYQSSAKLSIFRFQFSIFKSPSLIQFNFLNISPKIQVKIAGSMKHTNNIPSHIFVPPSGIAVMMPKGPTSPQVPIPAPIGTFSNWNTHVATGPVIAAAKVGGIHVKGFFMMLGI